MPRLPNSSCKRLTKRRGCERASETCPDSNYPTPSVRVRVLFFGKPGSRRAQQGPLFVRFAVASP
eukprot:8920246-Pyramimonas_sp.AAC.1